MSMFELIVVPVNPLVPSAYPPRVILEAEKEEQVKEWFKDAQEQQGQYVGCVINSIRKM